MGAFVSPGRYLKDFGLAIKFRYLERHPIDTPNYVISARNEVDKTALPENQSWTLLPPKIDLIPVWKRTLSD